MTEPVGWRPFRLLGIFFAGSPARQAAVLLALLVAGGADALSIATLLPVLSLVTDAPGAEASLAQSIVVEIITGLGLPFALPSLLVVFVAGLIVKAGFVMLAMNYVGISAASLATSLRRRLVAALLDAKWGYFNRQPAAHLSTAVSSEASRASAAYLDIAGAIANGLQVLIYLALCLAVSWRLSLFAAAAGLFMTLALSRLVITARRAGKRQTSRTRRLVRLLDDILAAAKPLKAMARQESFGWLYRREAGLLHRALTRQVLSRYALRSLQEPILGIFLAGGLFLALSTGQAALPELLVMALLLMRTARTAGRTQQAYQLAGTSESAYWAIREAIAQAEAECEPTGGTAVPTLQRNCALQEVWFDHETLPVLRGINLTIPSGRITVLTGPSGGGKSTLVDLLIGLYRPQRGRILVDGTPFEQLDLRQWRRMIGYVPQEVVLFNDTVAQNVTLGDPEIPKSAVEAALATAAAHFLVRLPDGLETVVGERGGQLSGGQRQRIALARALVHQPALLILDEATSGLDPETEDEVCDTIRRLTRECGLTVVAITHRPAWLRVADQAYRLEEGRLTPLPRLSTDCPAALAAGPSGS